MLFESRKETTNLLIEEMKKSGVDFKNAVFLGVSESSFISAIRFAEEFGVKFDFFAFSNIASPINSDCILGAISESGECVIDINLVESFGIDFGLIQEQIKNLRDGDIRDAISRYRHDYALVSLKGKDVYIVKSHITSGLGLECCINSIKSLNPKSINGVFSVLPKDLYDRSKEVCEHIFCIKVLEDFVSSDHYFKTLNKIDDEVLENALILRAKQNIEEHQSQHE